MNLIQSHLYDLQRRMGNVYVFHFLTGSLCLLISISVAAELPATDATVTLPAQESPWEPGPRSITAGIYYPGGALANVTADTGLFLTLHNWGGTGSIGTADPAFLVERYNVIAITVDYYQSGKYTADGPHPYDFGYLQALDALRALRFVYGGLQARQLPFHKGRIYATGGSGGGNVALMANKLAPRTFACVIDLCGMAKLNDDIAFGLEGGSKLDANYSRDPASPNFLSLDMQEIRFIGHPDHARHMKELGNTATIVVVHGVDDDVCPVEDAGEMVTNMAQAGLRVDAHFVTKEHLDGAAFKSTGHSLGDRTQIVDRVAGKYLSPESPDHATRTERTDFELRGTVEYKTKNGAWILDYFDGVPHARFLTK